MFKKGDIILTACILLAALCAAVILMFGTRSGNTVVILENNIETYRLPLNTNIQVNLTDNTVVIENGSVHMEYAGCPDKICVHHKKISARGESIICLPNGVVVEVE